MTPPSAPPLPGSMTVPPLFGWEHVLIALLVVVGAALVGLVLLAAGRAGSERDEFRAFLAARSAQRGDQGRDQGRDQSADTSTSTAATEPTTAAP
jgi:hypothetical protein